MNRIICTCLVVSAAACSARSRGSWESARSAYCDHLDNLRGDVDFELGLIVDRSTRATGEIFRRSSCMVDTAELSAVQNKVAGFVVGSYAVAAGRPEEMSPEYAGFDFSALQNAIGGERFPVDVCETPPAPEALTQILTKNRAQLAAGFEKALARCRAVGWKPAR